MRSGKDLRRRCFPQGWPATTAPLSRRRRGREWARAPIGASPLSSGDVVGRPYRRRPPARTGPRVSGGSFPVFSLFLSMSASRNRGTNSGREGAGFRLGLRSGCWCPASRLTNSLGELFRVGPTSALEGPHLERARVPPDKESAQGARTLARPEPDPARAGPDPPGRGASLPGARPRRAGRTGPAPGGHRRPIRPRALAAPARTAPGRGPDARRLARALCVLGRTDDVRRAAETVGRLREALDPTTLGPASRPTSPTSTTPGRSST
jgi:hypothetical protein